MLSLLNLLELLLDPLLVLNLLLITLKLGMLQSPLLDLFDLLLSLLLLFDLSSIFLGVPFLLLTMVLLQIFLVLALSLNEFLLLLDEFITDAFLPLLGYLSLRLGSVILLQYSIFVECSPLINLRLKSTDNTRFVSILCNYKTITLWEIS